MDTGKVVIGVDEDPADTLTSLAKLKPSCLPSNVNLQALSHVEELLHEKAQEFLMLKKLYEELGQLFNGLTSGLAQEHTIPKRKRST